MNDANISATHQPEPTSNLEVDDVLQNDASNKVQRENTDTQPQTTEIQNQQILETPHQSETSTPQQTLPTEPLSEPETVLPPAPPAGPSPAFNRPLHIETQSLIKQQRLQEILRIVQEKGSITTTQIRKLFQVSAQTARSYTNQLVESGSLLRKRIVKYVLSSSRQAKEE